jgi:hypothetical protein
VKINGINNRLQSTKQEQQAIYDHFLYCTKNEAPVRVIERFRHLFIRGTGYENYDVRLALEKIVEAADSESEFPCFINRCCHIIVNRWQMQPDLKLEIPQLVAQLELALPPGGANARNSRKLRQLVKDFQKSEQYVKLQRLARLIDLSPEARNKKERVEVVSNSVGDLIQRYPYLHQHCLLSEDSSVEFKQTVKTIQSQLQNNYEQQLSQYITNQVRLKELVRKYKAANKTKIPKKLVRQLANPTLLSDRELNKALHHYMGKVEGGSTYKELSLNFLTHTSKVRSYKAFKSDLYEYITSGIDTEYGKRQFNQQLEAYLQTILPDFHERRLDEFLIMRTYCQLFKLLVVDSKADTNHSLYLDLITHLGETKAIGLLLKLVLLCGKVKPYLENRFSILFAHYEQVTEDGVPWLIKSLENLQVAFSIYFGKADLSVIKIV